MSCECSLESEIHVNLYLCLYENIGVPQLKRAELETACEDFSNIIHSFEECTIYKGTLSSGVEIAVDTTIVTSSQDWSKNMEMAYRKKVFFFSMERKTFRVPTKFTEGLSFSNLTVANFVSYMLQIAGLSRVNHKNFTNLIGYCDEEEPFTRMMVFEYAPNGTLFEHLHGNTLLSKALSCLCTKNKKAQVLAPCFSFS